MTLELITAVALWCGQATPPVQIGTDLVVTRNPVAVDKCREELLTCFKKEKFECFKKEKLK